MEIKKILESYGREEAPEHNYIYETDFVELFLDLVEESEIDEDDLIEILEKFTKCEDGVTHFVDIADAEKISEAISNF